MIQILDFYADWCGPCKMVEPIFEQLEKEYTGKAEFKRVDVEAEGALANQYGIQSIPTFVMIKDGKEIDRKNGAYPKDVLKSWIEAHLR